MRLSKNFTLEEMTRSQTAMRHGIENTPNKHQLENLQRLVTDVLQPIRDELGPVYISSGFRSTTLNRIIGGSTTSAHMAGRAADFRVAKMTPFETCHAIKAMDSITYDQIINEFQRWVHLGIADVSRPPRFETLTAYRSSADITRYSYGLYSEAEAEEQLV